jgi:hypothetical protein
VKDPKKTASKPAPPVTKYGTKKTADGSQQYVRRGVTSKDVSKMGEGRDQKTKMALAPAVGTLEAQESIGRIKRAATKGSVDGYSLPNKRYIVVQRKGKPMGGK